MIWELDVSSSFFVKKQDCIKVLHEFCIDFSYILFYNEDSMMQENDLIKFLHLT